jgi:FAD/FMN-containing dehydrogenase
MAQFTGIPLRRNQKCIDAQKSLDKYDLKTRITKSEQEAKKYWTIRRESFNLLRHHSGDKRTLIFIDDFIVPPDVLPEFLPKLNKILEPYQKMMVYGPLQDILVMEIFILFLWVILLMNG